MSETKDDSLDVRVAQAVVGGCAVAFTVAGGSFAGAAVGQIFDIIPYIDDAIPEGIAIAANIFTPGDTVENVIGHLKNNLDKIGAVAGAAYGLFRGDTWSKDLLRKYDSSTSSD